MRWDLPERLADRVIFMDGRYIVEEGDPEEVFVNPKRRETITCF